LTKRFIILLNSTLFVTDEQIPIDLDILMLKFRIFKGNGYGEI